MPILLAAAAVLCVAAQTSPPPPAPVHRTVAFKATTDAAGAPVTLDMHVFRPEGWSADDRRAAIVFFFGGGWSGGDLDAFHPESRALAERGMVAICAEYRVARRHGTRPMAAVQDAKSALRYVRTHADELGVDPGRIAAGGGSAGGHLALATALSEGFEEPGEDLSVSSAPALLVLYNPVVDTAGPKGYGRERLGQDALALSPLHRIHAGLPPTIIFHGTEDRTVPISLVRQFRDAARAASAPCEVFESEGQGHGFFHPKDRVDLRSPRNALFLEHVDRAEVFLAEHGFIDPLPLRRTYLEPIAKELRSKWPANRTVNIVCHGHSVPAGYARTPLVKKADSYPFLLHLALDERYPFAPTNVIVTAKGGENAESGAERFEREVLCHRPDVLTIDYGLNDRAIGLKRAEQAWRSMIEAALAKGIRVLLLTPTWDTREDATDPEAPLRQHAQQIRALAEEYGVGLVDSLAAFDAHVAAGGTLDELMSQTNHPNRRGNRLVADELAQWFPR